MKKLIGAMIATLGLLTAEAQVPTEKTLLWEVSGKGVSSPSYLFGTIHLMCADELKMPEVVKTKFDATEQLFLEIDMDDPNMAMEMISGMQMNGNTTLENLMGKQFDTANAIFQSKTGIPLKMLNSAKPFLLMAMIYPSLLGCQPQSWEAEFQKLAKDKGLEIKGLEKLSDQMEVFEKIPYQVQSEMLIKLLQNMDSSKIAFNQMLDIYKTKDVNKLYKMTTSDADFGKYEGTLLNDRNQNWIPVIGEQAKKMSTFFAFGAGHLGGDKGVISLLRKAGYTVKPVLYQ
jgi:uncharacterized protein YbaP (TraB family)